MGSVVVSSEGAREHIGRGTGRWIGTSRNEDLQQLAPG